MANINRVILVGNLTRDPELRHTPSGTAVCEFGLAVNSREKVNDEWQDRADFFDVTVWGAQGENCAQYLAKGSAAGVDGKLRQDRWEQDGAKRSKIKVIADSVQFLTSRGHEDGEAAADTARQQDVETADAAAADF